MLRLSSLVAILSAVVFAPAETDLRPGMIHIRAERYSEAKSFFEDVLAKEPKNLSAHAGHAWATAGAQRTYGIEDNRKKAITDIEKEMREASTAAGGLNEELANAWVNIQALVRGWSDADLDKSFAEFLKAFPTSDRIRAAEVLHLAVAGKTADAESRANALVAASPKFADGYVARALVHEVKKEIKEAIADRQKAIELGVEYPAAQHFAIGLAYRALQNWDAAIASYGSAIKADDAQGRYFGERGIATTSKLAASDKHQAAEAALPDLERAVALGKYLYAGLLGDAYVVLGRLSYALGAYDNYIADGSDKANPDYEVRKKRRDDMRAAGYESTEKLRGLFDRSWKAKMTLTRTNGGKMSVDARLTLRLSGDTVEGTFEFDEKLYSGGGGRMVVAFKGRLSMGKGIPVVDVRGAKSTYERGPDWVWRYPDFQIQVTKRDSTLSVATPGLDGDVIVWR